VLYRKLEGIVIDDTELFNDKVQVWENFYNYTALTAISMKDLLRTTTT
jgi:hypothetical protein